MLRCAVLRAPGRGEEGKGVERSDKRGIAHARGETRVSADAHKKRRGEETYPRLTIQP